MAYSFLVYNRNGEYLGTVVTKSKEPEHALQEAKKYDFCTCPYPMVEPHTKEAWDRRRSHRIEFLPLLKGEKQ